MNKLKKLVKKDFIDKLNSKPSFDVNTLPIDDNYKFNKQRKIKRVKKVVSFGLLSLVSVFVVSFASLVMGLMIDIDENGKLHERRYSKNEIELIESGSYKKLNDITYPNGERNFYSVSQTYKEALVNFTYDIYSNVEFKDDFSYSPLTLYNNLSILSIASDDEDVNLQFDKLLYITKQERKENFIKTYLNNYFYNENGSVQMYNGLFTDYKFNISKQLIDEFTSYFTEVYSLDFANNQDILNMLSWVDNTINENNYLSPNDLKIDEFTSFILYSSLYFDNKWRNMYSEKDSYFDDFYLLNNTSKKVEYMTHTYFGQVYRYENYDSFYDYYKNGYKIQYVVPRFDLNLESNIYEIINGKNFLIEDENYLNEEVIITLNMPKFSSTCYYNFTELLKKIGLEKVFEKYEKPLNYLFENESGEDSIYLKDVFSKSKVSFNEDGTTIKNVSVSMGANATSSAPLESITYKLNQPFIYVIYDNNDIPIYLGQVDNP